MVKLIDSSVVAGAIRLYFGDKVSDVLPLSCSYNEELKRLAQVLTVFFSDGIPSVKVGIYLDKNGLKYSVYGDTYASVAEKCGSELMSSIHLNHVSLCKAIEEYLKGYEVENVWKHTLVEAPVECKLEINKISESQLIKNNQQ